eukprot:TRINITY_DN1699_c0_g1_i1.p1 TRINITY_DN1699_c0_g1~~TRINITY_DN1699_c0_g1_i1.p1  ORF type:complete len:228 (-),score=65.25 TRINITY_DN1699_c0_g1_i1:58-741(-)
MNNFIYIYIYTCVLVIYLVRRPIVTGTSVLGIKYKDGVMICADTLGSYGSLARFRQVSRLHQLGEHALLGASGDLSDFQMLVENLETMATKEYCWDDGSKLNAREYWSYLTRVLYQRRSKVDPYWNQLIIAGLVDGKPFLGHADLHGTTYEDSTLATGYGAYIARPLLRDAYHENLEEADARKILEDSMRVLFYRDARTINRVEFGKVTADGVEISDAVELDTEWDF